MRTVTRNGCTTIYPTANGELEDFELQFFEVGIEARPESMSLELEQIPATIKFAGLTFTPAEARDLAAGLLLAADIADDLPDPDPAYEEAARQVVELGAIRVDIPGGIYPAVFARPDRIIYLCRDSRNAWFPRLLDLTALGEQSTRWANELMERARAR